VRAEQAGHCEAENREPEASREQLPPRRPHRTDW
jgi:hypothetical protein